MGSIDMAVSSVSASLDFSSKKWKDLAMPLAKVYALQAGILLLLLIVGGIIGFAVIGGMLADLLDAPWGLALLALLFILVSLPAGIVMGALAAVAYNIVDAIERNAKEVPIIESARRILVPFAVYTVVQFGAITALLLVSGALGLAAFMVSPIAGAIGLPVFMMVSFIIIITISFLFQFAPLEIALNGAGGIEALKKSASLVRKNAAATLVFDLILFGVSMAIGIVFSIFSQIFSLGFAIAAIVPALFIALIAIMIIIYFVQSIAIGVLIMPMTYRFWKALGGRK